MQSQHTSVDHPVFARFYPRMSARLEEVGLSGHRESLLRGLHGCVLEVGAGNGLNFGHYPDEVTEVVAIEPEPRLREIAVAAAQRSSTRIKVIDGMAEALPFDDSEFDAVVASLVLCSLPDALVALRETHRVLKPGGELRFLEHVRAASTGLRSVQSTLDATIWPKLFAGCHVGRDTKSDIVAAGFEVQELQEFDFPPSRVRLPASPHILGIARKPAA